MDNLKKDLHITANRNQLTDNSEQVSVNREQLAESSDQTEQNYATIDDFIKIEIKIGLVKNAEKVEGSDKLLKLSVDFGEGYERQVFSGIAKFVTPEQMIGQKFPFVTNLKPRKIMGSESQAMILAVGDGDDFALLQPTKDVPEGISIK